MANVIDEILAERVRQVGAEGWTAQHDDIHTNGELVQAAACYCFSAAGSFMASTPEYPPKWWPWDKMWWKPKSRRRDLIRAAALIVAEIERLDRRPTAPPVPAETAPQSAPAPCSGEQSSEKPL